MIIQDERFRLREHTKSAEKFCNGLCYYCQRDERQLKRLEKDIKYLSDDGSISKTYCPVGLALGKRVMNFGIKRGDYNIVKKAADLEKVSAKNVVPKEMKNKIRDLRKALDGAKTISKVTISL